MLHAKGERNRRPGLEHNWKNKFFFYLVCDENTNISVKNTHFLQNSQIKKRTVFYLLKFIGPIPFVLRFLTFSSRLRAALGPHSW